ncbi:MAG: PAS domain-containing protein [Spirochaetales bacterium]|nr:PAS domain-containing protein [Spirochaetales bacterium]
MRKFIQRALPKLSKLDFPQVQALILDLAQENENLEVVLDSMTDGVLAADTENRVILCNKAAERLIPLTTGDVYDRLLWEVIEDLDISQFVQGCLVNQETIEDREFSLPGHGGNTRILSISVHPLVQAGKVQGNILHLQDISEKRWREARLRRAESLASLTTLTAGVAHEIKNPLGSIGIHIQLIQKMLAKKRSVTGDEISPLLEVMNEEVDRLNKIVVDFLFAVRPMDIRPYESCLNCLIRELLEFMQYELEQAKVKVVPDLEEKLPRIMIDEKFMKQAILNMVKNSMNAMPKGGTLVLSTRKKGDEVVFRIIDDGEGMSTEVMGKIFEPYFTTKDFGSGIGLTLVYKIIKEHGGDISVVSQEGRGTTFTLTFPIPQKVQKLLGEESKTEWEISDEI